MSPSIQCGEILINMTVSVPRSHFESASVAAERAGLTRRAGLRGSQAAAFYLVKERLNDRHMLEFDTCGSVAQLCDFLRRLERVLSGMTSDEPLGVIDTGAAIERPRLPAWLPGLIVWICAIFLVCLALKAGVKVK